MNNFAKVAMTALALTSTGLVSQQALAADCTDVNIVEVSAGHESSVQFDLAVFAKRVDNGGLFWTYARHSSFDHTGVQRIERLVTAALLAGKKVYLCWETNGNISKAYLK